MKKNIIKILYLTLLIVGFTGCFNEDNPPDLAYNSNDYWGSGFNSKAEFLNDLKRQSIDLSSTIFYSDAINPNGTSEFEPYAFIEGYQITQSRITATQFAAFLNDIGCNADGSYLNIKYFQPSLNLTYYFDSTRNQNFFVGLAGRPAINVTWFGAQAFCVWAGGRLPTEAEWVNTSRELSPQKYGMNSILYGFCGSDSENETAVPNSMIAEWCFDWYEEPFAFNKIEVNPIGPNSGTKRVMRGGKSSLSDCNNESRMGLAPDENATTIGFRCVWDVEDNSSGLTVQTLAASSISSTTAILSCSVSTTGGSINYIQSGFLWDTLPNPDFNHCLGILKSAAGEKIFSSRITGLDFDQTYHVKSFALNKSGIIMGQEVTFKTLPAMIGSQNGLIEMEMINVAGVSYHSSSGTQIIHSFRISKYEVTNLQFCEYLTAIGAENISSYLVGSLHITSNINHVWIPETGFENYPVVNVIWGKAAEFCRWAGGRLPNKNEWEYAALGGKESPDYLYSGSNSIDDVCWYYNNSNNFHTGWKSIHPVGQKSPNEIGIYDMSGNASEWCSNIISTYDAITKGGSYNDNSTNCQISIDGSSSLVPNMYEYVGFRLLKEAEKVE